MSGAGEPLTVQEWWTPAELARLGLPDLPSTERAIQMRAEELNWRAPEREWSAACPNGIWRKRQGRGGGYEYRYDVLPLRAKTRLQMKLRKAQAVEPRTAGKTKLCREEMWKWFDQLPERKKSQARTKLDALNAMRDLIQAGTERDIAKQLVAVEAKISLRTLYNWEREVDGIDRADWLPYLTPRHAGRQATSDCSAEAWEWFKAYYLRLEQPTFADAYRRLEKVAAEKGWTIPSRKTLERRIAALDTSTRVALRQGSEALKKLYPAQQRDRSVFHALEAVNADGHKWDVFVKWPTNDPNKFDIVRPQMVAFQDLHSGMILSWRVDKSENKEAVRLAFGDIVEQYGIPEHCVLDNGRAFSSKWISGGVQNRFRFKIREEDPYGIMPSLGVEVHWATPYSGQSKPIERAFKDFAQNISKDPRFAGAWTGNTVDAKPENYGSKAVPLETFLAVIAEGITEHNTRLGRRSKVCNGQSFAGAFWRSYEENGHLIRRATEAQRRLWLLAAEQVTATKPAGSVFLEGNRYWAEFLVNHIGEKLVLRLDPQALHDGVHVYRNDGAWLGHAPCVEAVGFNDVNAAREHAQQRRKWLRAAKDKAAAELQLSMADLAALQPKIDVPEMPETQVVRPVFGNLALAAMPEAANEQDIEHDQEAVLLSFGRALKKMGIVREGGAD